MLPEQKKPRVYGGKIAGQDAKRIGYYCVRASCLAAVEKFGITVEEAAAAYNWYLDKQEKARGQKKRAARATSKTALTKKLDSLCRQLVYRRGSCEAKGHIGVECKGRMEWAHGISRKHRILRWEPDSHWLLCSAHHLAFTHDPILWSRFVELWPERAALIERLRNVRWDRDHDAVLARLTALTKETSDD